MSILQPIDLPALVSAVVWPLLAALGFIMFRRPLNALFSAIGQRVRKLSVAGVSVELTEARRDPVSQVLDTEIRQLDAGLIPQSGVPGLTGLLSQVQSGPLDLIVIDLGSDVRRRWLTSRLYILSLLMTLVDRAPCLAFVEEAGAVRRRFVGLAYATQVRWCLARAYGWLEVAAAGAYAMSLGSLVCSPTPRLQPNLGAVAQFDAATGSLSDYQLGQLLQEFLTAIRQPPPPAGIVPPEAADWIAVGDQSLEHAKWLDGSRVEHLLGANLDTSYVTLMANASINGLAIPVLQQRQPLVAVLDPDKSFRGLVDRSALLEKLATGFSKQELPSEHDA